MNNGLPFVPVLDFDCFNFDNTRLLRVATYGRGIFELDLEHYTSVNEDISNAAKLKVWPNPASELLWIEFPALTNDKYTLSLLSVYGTEVASQVVYIVDSKFRTSIGISGLIPGCYQLVLKGDRILKATKVMILR
jgi:hypothetical protein